MICIANTATTFFPNWNVPEHFMPFRKPQLARLDDYGGKKTPYLIKVSCYILINFIQGLGFIKLIFMFLEKKQEV